MGEKMKIGHLRSLNILMNLTDFSFEGQKCRQFNASLKRAEYQEEVHAN